MYNSVTILKAFELGKLCLNKDIEFLNKKHKLFHSTLCGKQYWHGPKNVDTAYWFKLKCCDNYDEEEWGVGLMRKEGIEKCKSSFLTR